MTRIIDLDLIAPPGVIVRTHGVDYKLPGDPPTSLWLSIIDAHDQHIASEGSEHFNTLRVFHDRMLALFQIENPDLQALPFGPGGMISILIGFYGAPDEDDLPADPPGAGEAASTTTTTNGHAASPAKRPRARKTATASASSRS